MTMSERTVWASVFTFALVAVVYVTVIATRAAQMPVEEVSWVAPMIWAMGSLIVVIVVGTIASAIATGIAAGARGEKAEYEEGDVRDKQIELVGNARAHGVSGLGGFAALILMMLDAPTFWVANTLFVSGLIAGLTAALVKVRAYRNGV